MYRSSRGSSTAVGESFTWLRVFLGPESLGIQAWLKEGRFCATIP
jgi:hypothetical protein